MSNLLAFLEYMNFNKQKVDIFLKSIERAGPKGQLISKADWHAIDSPKNERMNLFCLLFCFSWQTNQIRLFVFRENLKRANLLFGFICV